MDEYSSSDLMKMVHAICFVSYNASSNFLYLLSFSTASSKPELLIGYHANVIYMVNVNFGIIVTPRHLNRVTFTSKCSPMLYKKEWIAFFLLMCAYVNFE